mmetsp:Transcript_8191/g.12086  ORF Transcript_8191/g.12086 Transcript_8191/m.12086 type:complete len:317 (+) Transcript_8191:414-1364(+)
MIAGKSDSHLRNLLHSKNSLFIRNDVFLSSTNSQDSTLSRRKNGIKLTDSEHTKVRDGKCSGCVLIWGQCSSLCLTNKFLPVLAKFHDVSFISILESRSDKTTINGNSHSNINISLKVGSSIFVRTVDNGEFLNSKCNSLGKQGRNSNTLGLDTLVQCVKCIHFNFSANSEDGRSKCFLHVVRDSTLHCSEGYETIRKFNWSSSTSCCLLSLGLLFSSRHLDIISSDTTELTSSLDGGKINLGLLRKSTGCGCSSDNTRCGDVNRLGRCSGSSCLLGCSTRRCVFNIRCSNTSTGASTNNGAQVKSKLSSLFLGEG